MPYRSTKHYGHEVGLSTCFRQWRADSHCALLHGYALAFRFVFEADELDIRNWVVDFGGLDLLKVKLKQRFDHTMLVAKDDPQLHILNRLEELGLAKIHVMDKVGCEAFAEAGYLLAVQVLKIKGYDDRVRVVSCEVSEHGANSAIYVN